MSKKLLVFLFVVLLMTAFAACGGDDDNKTTSSKKAGSSSSRSAVSGGSGSEDGSTSSAELTDAPNNSPIFISEIGLGGNNNKYIELYNRSGSTVQLAGYELWSISATNTASKLDVRPTDSRYVLELTGESIPAGGCWVIGHYAAVMTNISASPSSAGATIQKDLALEIKAAVDANGVTIGYSSTTPGCNIASLTYNNQVIVLVKDDVVVDVWGKITGTSAGTGLTGNDTWVRKPGKGANTVWNVTRDWDAQGFNKLGTVGKHDFDGTGSGSSASAAASSAAASSAAASSAASSAAAPEVTVVKTAAGTGLTVTTALFGVDGTFDVTISLKSDLSFTGSIEATPDAVALTGTYELVPNASLSLTFTAPAGTGAVTGSPYAGTISGNDATFDAFGWVLALTDPS